MALVPNLPNGKCDVNSIGPFSTNLLDGSSWASYQRRQEIWKHHLHYTQSVLYFLSHDPDVPEPIRHEMRRWGLCADEFADTGHWPHQLYVRDARRMRGEYWMTQTDLQTQRVKRDSIGMGSYNIDIREVQRTWTWGSRFHTLVGETFNEGYLSVPVAPYAIPYRSLVPQFHECENLLVPVCIGITCGLCIDPHGATIHDFGPCCRRCSSNGSETQRCRAADPHRRIAAHIGVTATNCSH